jgi:hypothetical protein
VTLNIIWEGFVAEHESQPKPADQWGWVVVTWALVAVPLLWGVWNTLVKASALFK